MLVWLGLCVFLYQLGRFQRHNPWPRIFLGGVAWIAGVDVRVAGTQASGGRFLLANHVSWIDIPAIAGATGAAFVAHDGLAANPFMRWLCAMNDTVFIARHDRGSVAGQVEQLRAALRENGALAIFPEGTTSSGEQLLPFKSSLLSALVPSPAGIAVQPVLMDYGADSALIAWIGEEPGIDNFMRILARAQPIELTLHFLSPLSGEALGNRKIMAAQASAALEAQLRRDQRVAL